jgi:DNA repair exonuclease SbcCD ATPase subunit
MAEKTSIEQVTAKLQQMLSAINDGNAELEVLCEEIAARKDSRHALIEELSSQVGTAAEQFTGFGERLAHAGERQQLDHESALTRFPQFSSRVEMFAAMVENSETQLKQLSSDAAPQLAECAQDMRASQELALTSWNSSDELLERLRRETDSVCGSFDQECSALRRRVEQSTASVATLASSAAEQLADEQRRAADLFESFNAHVAETLTANRDAALHDMAACIGQAWTPLQSASHELANDVCRAIVQVSQELGELAAQSLTELQQGGDAAVGNALQAAQQEVSAYQQVLEPATASISALEPILAKLACADHVLETFAATVEKISEE